MSDTSQSRTGGFVTDFADICGHEAAKRALTVALVDKHSFVLVGPRGNGKSLLISAARCAMRKVLSSERGSNADTLSWGREERLCPCGYYTDVRVGCNCSSEKIKEHAALVMALDADIWYQVPTLPAKDLFSSSRQTTSDEIISVVVAARKIPRGNLRPSKLPQNCVTMLTAAIPSATLNRALCS